MSAKPLQTAARPKLIQTRAVGVGPGKDDLICICLSKCGRPLPDQTSRQRGLNISACKSTGIQRHDRRPKGNQWARHPQDSDGNFTERRDQPASFASSIWQRPMQRQRTAQERPRTKNSMGSVESNRLVAHRLLHSNLIAARLKLPVHAANGPAATGGCVSLSLWMPQRNASCCHKMGRETVIQVVATYITCANRQRETSSV